MFKMWLWPDVHSDCISGRGFCNITQMHDPFWAQLYVFSLKTTNTILSNSCHLAQRKLLVPNYDTKKCSLQKFCYFHWCIYVFKKGCWFSLEIFKIHKPALTHPHRDMITAENMDNFCVIFLFSCLSTNQ